MPTKAPVERCTEVTPGPSLGSMLFAEDLLLLLTNDATGKLIVPAAQVDVALGGANLIELTLLERVGLDDRKRVVVHDPSSTGDPILDGALGIIGARQGKKPKSVVEALGKNLRTALYGRLVAAGVLRAEESKVLGLFPVHRWPAARAEHEEHVRTQLTQVLVQRTTPDSRTAALVSLLYALKSEQRIVDPKEHGLTRKELQTRAKEISTGDWASEAVRQAIEAMTAAVVASTTAAVVASTTAATAG
jgi:Golgi phosphoprotein 3 (GPP34)